VRNTTHNLPTNTSPNHPPADRRHLYGSLAFAVLDECSPAGRTRSRRVTTGS
jgi:hypothetical protein